METEDSPELVAQAKEAYRRALSLDPEDTASTLSLAQLLLQQDDRSGAKRVLTDAFRRTSRTSVRR